MQRAIYILGDDAVSEQVATLCYSARRAGETSHLVLIPHSDSHARCLALGQPFGLKLMSRELVDTIDRLVQRHLRGWPLRYPQRLRSLAPWLDEARAFVYLDADILLFRSLDDVFEALESHQFVTCDYQWRTGFRHVFDSAVATREGYSPRAVFNAGFWGSRGDALSRITIEGWFESLREARPLFEFANGTTDQPMINHLVATAGLRHCNLTQQDNSREPGSWAGSTFQRRGDVLYDRDRPLRYLHWAGLKLDANAPYGDLWAEYRNAALVPSASEPESE